MSRDTEFGFYLVGFVDILGQTDRLQGLEEISTNQESVDRIVQILRETAGVVLGFRQMFQRFFEGVSRPTGLLDGLPRDLREEAYEMRQMRVFQRNFSDTVVLAVPATSGDENCTAVNSIQAALLSLCATFIGFLSQKQVFRAGVDLGLGLQVEPEEVYGPVLGRAHYLESEVAGYPRVVVGDNLVSFLDQVVRQQSNSRLGEFASKVASQCKELLVTDYDGHQILDFLGPRVKELIEIPQMKALVEKAYHFSVDECTRWTERKDQKLAERYAHLRAYFESRLSIWGVEKIPA